MIILAQFGLQLQLVKIDSRVLKVIKSLHGKTSLSEAAMIPNEAVGNFFRELFRETFKTLQLTLFISYLNSDMVFLL